MNRGGLPIRTSFAVATGRAVAAASRAARVGSGSVIGGRVALRLDPSALRRLSEGRTVVLVTGTNGKTTTSLMLTRALEALAPVAANSDGANMPDGVLAALAARPDAPYAVLEVDETYLPWVAERIQPAALILLNLSRDQLDRVGEVRAIERGLRDAIARLPDTLVVGNCDDVLVTSAASVAARVLWVGTGSEWHSDAMSCPRCGAPVQHGGGHWWCDCGLARPDPHWTLDGDRLTGPDGVGHDLKLGLPGEANRSNAAVAAALTADFGVKVPASLDRLSDINDVGGRYCTIRRGPHSIRLILAKNPAGWAQALQLLSGSRVVIAVNAREADGRDLSWLWDVPFEQMRSSEVVAAGERSADLAVRLRYAEVEHARMADPLNAVDSLTEGSVDVVANYTAFRDLAKRLGRDG